MNKFSLAILSLHGILYVFLLSRVAHGKTAQPLFKFHAASETYEFNRSFVAEIVKLPLPIRVIAMHGDPRVGKSTILNMVINVWNGANNTFVEEIFPTGDNLALSTRGVWAYITKGKEGSVILLDVEAAGLGDDMLVVHLHMFTEMISSGMNILVREHIQNSNLEFLFFMARLKELVFPHSSRDNFLAKLRVIVRGAVNNPGGRSVEDYTRDFIAGNFESQKGMKERKIIAKYFPKSDISVSQIPHVDDLGIFKDFKKLSRSDYMRAVETLAREFKEFPIKRTLEGSPMDGVALAELMERLAETISADGWQDFASIYDTIESNICKRSEAKFVAPVFKLKSEQIKSEKKDRLDAFAKECRLENGLTSAREKLQQIFHAKQTLEDLEIILAEYDSKKMEGAKKRDKSEEEIQEIIAEKDKEITEETKARQEAEQKAQSLMKKLNTCESLLKAEIEKGTAFSAEIPVGAELLYTQGKKQKEETHCNDKILYEMFDEIKKLKEDQKRIIYALERKYSIQEFSEALVKVVGLCSGVISLAQQIRALFR
ncbi:hypothetical protein ACROYT_G024949 [Oculina patagonica]